MGEAVAGGHYWLVAGALWLVSGRSHYRRIPRFFAGAQNDEQGAQVAGVGLSNICYTVLDEIMECIFWRFPSKRSHWEAVIISIIISFELYSEIFKREETMCGIKAFVILAMTAFYFPIVSWGKGTNLFVLDA